MLITMLVLRKWVWELTMRMSMATLLMMPIHWWSEYPRSPFHWSLSEEGKSYRLYLMASWTNSDYPMWSFLFLKLLSLTYYIESLVGRSSIHTKLVMLSALSLEIGFLRFFWLSIFFLENRYFVRWNLQSHGQTFRPLTLRWVLPLQLMISGQKFIGTVLKRSRLYSVLGFFGTVTGCY